MKTNSPTRQSKRQASRRGEVSKTAAQKRAGEFLELHGMIHFLLTEQRCPVIFDGKLAYVSCPGVSKEAFKLAIDKRVQRNLLAYLNLTTTKP